MARPVAFTVELVPDSMTPYEVRFDGMHVASKRKRDDAVDLCELLAKRMGMDWKDNTGVGV